MLGPQHAAPEVRLVQEAPTYVKRFATREYIASEFPFRALRDRTVAAPCPWTGALMSCRAGFSQPAPDGLPYEMVPLYYGPFGTWEREFWLISYAPNGRVTHLFLPSLGVV